jgi:hypothetical protein
MPSNDGITNPLQIAASSQFPLRFIGSTSRTSALQTPGGFTILTQVPQTAAAAGMLVDKPSNGILYQLCFYGVGSNNNWFEGHIIGYKEVQRPDSKLSEYMPRVLAHFKGQLRSTTVSTGTFLLDKRPADHLEIVSDYTPCETAKVSTNPEDGIATLTLDARGHEFIAVELSNRVPAGETGSASTEIAALGSAL